MEMVILGMPKELYEVMYRMVQSLLKFIKKRKQKCVYTPGSYGRAKKEKMALDLQLTISRKGMDAERDSVSMVG